MVTFTWKSFMCSCIRVLYSFVFSSITVYFPLDDKSISIIFSDIFVIQVREWRRNCLTIFLKHGQMQWNIIISSMWCFWSQKCTMGNLQYKTWNGKMSFSPLFYPCPNIFQEIDIFKQRKSFGILAPFMIWMNICQ